MAKRKAIAKMAQNAVNVVDGAYVNFVSNLNTGRDKASHGQFLRDGIIPDFELESIYQDWLAKRIINRPVSDSLRAGWYFSGLNDEELTKLNNACTRIELVPRVIRLLILTRLYGRAYMVIGVNDGKSLIDELDVSQLRTDGLLFLTVLKKSQVEIDDKDLLKPEEAAGLMNQPRYYKMKRAAGGYERIHHSRIICMRNGEEEEPVFQAIKGALRNYAGTNAGAASLVHEAKVDVIRVPDLMSTIVNQGKELFARFQSAALLKGINGMLVIDEKEGYESKSYTFGGLPELMREFAIQTSGAADIPYTVLFGQAPAGMNSTGEHDTRNYYDRIATDQAWILRPLLNKLFSLICQSTFGGLPKNFSFSFNPLWQLDPKIRAELEKANSDRDKTYIELGVLTEAQAARQLRDDGTYTVIDDDHIAMLESMTSQQVD